MSIPADGGATPGRRCVVNASEQTRSALIRSHIDAALKALDKAQAGQAQIEAHQARVNGHQTACRTHWKEAARLIEERPAACVAAIERMKGLLR